jgi:anti-sigma B factor antagonist
MRIESPAMADFRHETRADGTVVITASGALTIYTLHRLRELTISVIAAEPPAVVIDLDAVTWMDSTGLGVLVGARRRLQGQGGRLAVACSREDVRRLLRVTGLLDVLRVVPSIEEALAVLGTAA